MHLFRIVLFVCLWLMAGNAVSASEQVLLLIFKEQDASGGAFISRMIVSEKFLRLDYGPAQSDFILFDRQSKIIKSVVYSTRTVMIINPRKITQHSPIKIDTSSEQISSDQVNILNSSEMLHIRFFANKDRCLDSFIIPKLLPSVTQALTQYYEVLAGEHAQTIHLIPGDIIDACDLAMNIFSSARRFDSGFPIRESILNGTERILLDYDENFMLDEQWRHIPEAFKPYSPSQIRGEDMNTQKSTGKNFAQK